MNNKLRCTTALLSVCSLLASCGQAADPDESFDATSSDAEYSEFFEERSAAQAATEQSSIYNDDITDTNEIVVLGDSIAYGYGLEDREAEAFPFIVSRALSSGNAVFSCRNYAVNGHASGDMLADIETAEELDESTDIVFISVGGNNLLGIAADIVYELAASYREASDTSTSSGIISEPALLDSAAEGIEKLRHDIPLFIAAIKAKAPNAKIYYQTVYNPYKKLKLPLGNGTEFDFGSLCDGMIRSLNEVICGFSEELGYEIIDVYGSFEKAFEDGSPSPVNVSLNIKDFSVDPHPSKYGHELIAELYIKTIKN